MDNQYQYQIDIISALAERTIKRLWILIIILVLLLFGSNVAWIVYESSFVDQVVTQTADSGQGGTATIYDGVHINGEGYSNSKDSQEEVREGNGVQTLP